ncbi:AP-3 complex subunit beta-2 [Frankliniella fusca]|uniref:AP-3 complex subunit beta n=1 Tax=Frankliniella fusca TaxID=407009 RepID=A0AAE1I016_9NEOP|nr:AP-3 complex subunit beta-2 [Frankliniella fusca]
MSNNGSYNNDRPASAVEAELATDPASGGFFHSDYKKHDDLKQMLDSSKDGLKLEAMKRIIGMVAKGRDASDLFPAVVKNVVSKNIEVKKLVYVYLVRYAEEQQDLALLSISTFQRALKDPNQLIRASALRVLSSIRVTMIVPIVMLAIKDSASDMSAYVRKTAAHAIPKLYSLDPEQKEELVHVIEKLLSDRTTLVVGSAVMAFEEVCPERIDLIHKNYRKLCDLLVDVDEWGQVVIINMLTRYARTQFTDPNAEDEENQNEDNCSDENENLSDSDGGKQSKSKHKNDEKFKKSYSLDPDHRLLLRNARPLLQSRNASVVMGVAQMYHHLAPRSEVIFVAKALIRLLRSHREVQSVVLNCIASMSTQRKGMFEPFLKSFFVRTSDATHIKLLKLEILTTLATETSISVILREFQTYISSNDKEFVTATIQAIGRCAANIKEVTDTCLNGLVSLLSNRDGTEFLHIRVQYLAEAVVGESVVVIKKLLQTQPAEHKDIITHMARLVDNISVPAARASILWLLGEYSDRVPRIAPDVLRKMAKSFINEEDQVKLQTLNLAVKLFLVNPKQTKLLCQYVLNLARYDPSYDIRDRARFLKQFVFPSNENAKLAKSAKKIFLATKPAPVSESQFKDREQFQLGSLSHYINTRAVGYHDLPAFPEVAPESNRGVAAPPDWPERTKDVKRRGDAFYNSDSSPADEIKRPARPAHTNRIVQKAKSLSESGGASTSSDEGSESPVKMPKGRKNRQSDSDSNSSSGAKKKGNELKTKTSKQNSAVKKKEKTDLDLLLELDDSAPLMTPSLGGFLTPSIPTMTVLSSSSTGIQTTSPSFVALRSKEIINKVAGRGLVISYRYTRSPHLFSSKMAAIELTFSNQGLDEITDLKMGAKNMPSGLSVHEFAPVSSLAPGTSLSGTIGVDWNDTTQPASFDIIWRAAGDERKSSISIKPNVGELLTAVTMPDFLFLSEQGKLRGMNEHSAEVKPTLTSTDTRVLCQRVYESANVSSIPSSDAKVLRFAAQTLASQSLVLITVKVSEQMLSLCVNCEKMVIGSMLCNEIKSAFRQ